MAGAAFVALVATGSASGDAGLASAKVSQAERAINEAKQGNAGVTAPLDLKMAEDKLTAARAAASKGEYDEAMRQADQALVTPITRARAAIRTPRSSTDAAEHPDAPPKLTGSR
jgi:hypothetical protein